MKGAEFRKPFGVSSAGAVPALDGGGPGEIPNATGVSSAGVKKLYHRYDSASRSGAAGQGEKKKQEGMIL